MTTTENSHQKPETAQKEIKQREHTPPLWFFWRARRYVVTLFLFFGMACSFAMRTNMSIAIVAMTQFKNVTLQNGTLRLQREFEWDTILQGHALSSFFYGFLIAQLISGYMSVRRSGKIILATGLGVASILTLLTPLAANLNIYLFLVLRAATGFFEGTLSPAVVSIWAKWIPPLERNRLVNFCQAGTFFGTIISLSVSPLVTKAFGWESIFYLFGSLGTLWTILWIILVSNSPHEDSRISDDELNYLMETLNISPNKTVHKTPWKELVTSTPVWALLFLNFVDSWGFYTLLTQMPKFMTYILNYNLKETGFMSSLQYILLVIMLMLCSYIADTLMKRKLISTTNLRKMFAAIGLLFQCIFSILAVHLMSPIGSTFCLLIAVGFDGFTSSVVLVNFLDLSPRFGSLILGVASLLGHAPGVISPTITGYIVTDETNVYQWRIIFYISAGLYFLGLIFYTIFGSGKVQKWNDSEEIRKAEDQKKEIN